MQNPDPWRALNTKRLRIIVLFATLLVVGAVQLATGARVLVAMSPFLQIGLLAAMIFTHFSASREACPRCDQQFMRFNERRQQFIWAWTCQHCNAMIGDDVSIDSHEKEVLLREARRSAQRSTYI
jgi:ribosomal protein L37AE/L43A